MITLIGMGSGTPGSLTAQGLAALQGADRILGAKRLLATLPEGCTGNRQALYKPDEILACLAAHPDEEIALVYSGDTGFYSGASQLLPMLRAFGISCRVLPGLHEAEVWRIISEPRPSRLRRTRPSSSCGSQGARTSGAACRRSRRA